MRVRVEFTLNVYGGSFVQGLPLDFELDGARVFVNARGGELDLDLSVEIPIDGSSVNVVTDVRDAATGQPNDMLDVAETATASVIANRVADSISFIARQPSSLARKELFSEIIPESDQDAALISALGTSTVRGRLGGGSLGIWIPWPLDARNIAFLCGRPAAARLYANALKMGTSGWPAA